MRYRSKMTQSGHHPYSGLCHRGYWTSVRILPSGSLRCDRIPPLTTTISLYGALALALNAGPAVVVEFVLVMGFVWVLFVKPEPVV
jgi:hypothetical protein